jgi:error-prone DNA polymerase
MRPDLGEDVLSSERLARARDGERVRVAGMVVARQRPATAHGITFMLLEDELGTINLIVPVKVYEKHRLTVRSEPLIMADGKLEHREGVTNVLVSSLRRLERPDLPVGEVRHIEPRRIWSNDDAGDELRDGNLRAVVPAAHSFGRRG